MSTSRFAQVAALRRSLASSAVALAMPPVVSDAIAAWTIKHNRAATG